MWKQIGLALALLPACATSFTGSAHISGGRAGCEAKCSTQGLIMSGLVFLGEYSTACVCSVPAPAHAPAAQSRRDALSALAAIGGAAAGVIMEKQSQELTRNQTIAY